MTKELKKMMKINDFVLVRQKKHAIWGHTITKKKVVTSNTGSDWRELKNTQREINKVLALVA